MLTRLAMSNMSYINTLKEKMSTDSVMHHSFLTEFESKSLDRTQLKTFAVQWYKTARAHKQAFPALIYNTRDDDVRFDLIDILNEEYGDGNRELIHARLLMRFLNALGLSERDVEQTETLPAVRDFSEQVLRIWRDEDPVYAFGLHFALEYLASSLHVHFARGLDKYSFLNDHDKEYFNYHKTAEKEHADFSERGFLLYAKDEDSQSLLEKGVDKATDLMKALWDEFYAAVFCDELALAI